MTQLPQPSAKHRVPPSLTLGQNSEGVLSIRIEGNLERLAQATRNADIINGLYSQIAVLGSYGSRIDEGASNFVLGFVDSMAPRDAAEALLLTQMAAIHQATMMMARRINHVETLQQQDAAERALNKLARSFAAQVEALKRYRSTGQQKVTVEHVTVNAGGQAIVGSVTKGGGAEGK